MAKIQMAECIMQTHFTLRVFSQVIANVVNCKTKFMEN